MLAENSQPPKIEQTAPVKNNRVFVNSLTNFLLPFVAIFLAFLVGAIPIAIAGVNPLDAYRELMIGAFGSKFGISDTSLNPRRSFWPGSDFHLLARCGLFNIGGRARSISVRLGRRWLASS